MDNFPNSLADKIWLFFIGITVIVSIALLMVLVSSMKADGQYVNASSSYSVAPADMSNSPNLITSGMARLGDTLDQATSSTMNTVGDGLDTIAAATATGSKTAFRGAQTGITFIARGIGKGAVYTGTTIGKGAVYAASMPGKAVASISNSSVVNSVLRPSDEAEVPIIDPDSPELAAAVEALAKAEKDAPQNKQKNPGSAWPIHGRITTEFGVPHWPYQRTHTGLDISDSKRSGVTPIRPFRAGRVVEVIFSSYGYGNHVIVDHGNNVTSLYGHLYSIAVKEGQEVDGATVLGTEGSTGMSTGTHLHLEIRVNGQAADPRKFIQGHP